MNYSRVTQLKAFEACASCPLNNDDEQPFNMRGMSLRHDVGSAISKMQRLHPGVVVQHIDPPESAQKIIDIDDEDMQAFLPAIWRCVRAKQRHGCDHPSVVDVVIENNVL